MGIFFGGGFSGWELSGWNHPCRDFPGESFPSTIHERALKIIYEDYNSSFIKELHRKDSSLT